MNYEMLHGVEETRREYLLQLVYSLYTVSLKTGDMVGRQFGSTNISEENIKLGQKTSYLQEENHAKPMRVIIA